MTIDSARGKRTEAAKGIHFRFLDPGEQGFELLVKTRSGKPLSLRIREVLIGLLEVPWHSWPQPPPWIAPLYPVTALMKTFVF